MKQNTICKRQHKNKRRNVDMMSLPARITTTNNGSSSSMLMMMMGTRSQRRRRRQKRIALSPIFLILLVFVFIFCCNDDKTIPSAVSALAENSNYYGSKSKLNLNLNLKSSSISSRYDGCEEIFVGSGWGGVYSFYRRVVTSSMENPLKSAHKACLFEQSWRVGGRTYSVPINHTGTSNTSSSFSSSEGQQQQQQPHFVQDIGAYRYSPDMHLPGDLILNDLNLTTECYQQDCPSAKTDFPPSFFFNYTQPLRRIIDPITKLPIGYVTPIHKMIEIATQLGGRVFLQTSLTKLTFIHNDENENEDEDEDENEDVDDDGQNNVSLEFTNTNDNIVEVIHSPSLVVLNLPRNKLFDVKGVEESLQSSPDTVKILKCIVFDTPSGLFGNSSEINSFNDISIKTTLEKAYLYYSNNAWWRTLLHKYEGGYPKEEFESTPAKDGVRFNIRFHDGPVYPVGCTEDDDNCFGLLQIYYSVSNETVYSSLTEADPNEPLGTIWDTDDDPNSILILTEIHNSLMELMSPLLKENDINVSQIELPSGLIVGTWNRPTEEYPLGYGYTAPTKVLYDPNISGLPQQACGLQSEQLTDTMYRDTVLQPWRRKRTRSLTTQQKQSDERNNYNNNIFLINNDYICMNVNYFFGDWAEESLLQAERAMYILSTTTTASSSSSSLNDNKPSWLNELYYKTKVTSQVNLYDKDDNEDEEEISSSTSTFTPRVPLVSYPFSWTTFSFLSTITGTAILILILVLVHRKVSSKSKQQGYIPIP